MNNVLGLKLAQIGSKGLQVLDRHIKVTDSKRRIVFKRLGLTALIVLSVWNLFNASGTVNLSKKQLDLYFPPFVTHAILLMISYISAVKLLIMEYFSTIPSFTIDFKWLTYYASVTNGVSDLLKLASINNVVNETDFMINSAAIMLSIFLVLENGVKRHGSILLMLLWNVNMLWPKIAEGMVNSVAGDFLKVSVQI